MNTLTTTHWAPSFLYCALFLAALFCLSLQTASAQNSSTGALAGTVTDASGAVVPDAEIRVRSEVTGSVIAVKSMRKGNYTAPLLPPGTYTVELAKPGFKLWINNHVRVAVTETSNLDVRLQVGQVLETVVVQSEASPLQTESSALGHVTGEEAIES